MSTVLWMFTFPPKFMLELNCQSGSVKRWAFRRWLNRVRRVLTHEVSNLIKRGWRELARAPLPSQEGTPKRTKEIRSLTVLCQFPTCRSLILDSPASRNLRNKITKFQIVCYSSMYVPRQCLIVCIILLNVREKYIEYFGESKSVSLLPCRGRFHCLLETTQNLLVLRVGKSILPMLATEKS